MDVISLKKCEVVHANVQIWKLYIYELKTQMEDLFESTKMTADEGGVNKSTCSCVHNKDNKTDYDQGVRGVQKCICSYKLGS